MEHFSGSFGVHTPAALDVSFVFKCTKERVYCAGSKVGAKGFPYFAHYLVTVHGFLVEELEDNHV